MNIDQLAEFFKWMTIINIGLFFISTLAVFVLKSVMLKLHSKLFGLTDSQISLAVYSYLGGFKLLLIFFNIVPYCALLLISS